MTLPLRHWVVEKWRSYLRCHPAIFILSYNTKRDNQIIITVYLMMVMKMIIIMMMMMMRIDDDPVYPSVRLPMQRPISDSTKLFFAKLHLSVHCNWCTPLQLIALHCIA